MHTYCRKKPTLFFRRAFESALQQKRLLYHTVESIYNMVQNAQISTGFYKISLILLPLNSVGSQVPLQGHPELLPCALVSSVSTLHTHQHAPGLPLERPGWLRGQSSPAPPSEGGWDHARVNFLAHLRASPAASLLSSDHHPSLYTTPMFTDLPVLLSALEKTLELCYPLWVVWGFFTSYLTSGNVILNALYLDPVVIQPLLYPCQ